MHNIFSAFIVLSLAVCSVFFGMLYFRKYRIDRPPVGVLNLSDLLAMMVGIVFVPFLYLILPVWIVAGLLGLSALNLLYTAWQPIVRSPLVIWTLCIVFIGADMWTAFQFGVQNNIFFAINDVVIIMLIIGLANLWAQSGMKARDVAILASFLAVYDLIATTLLPLMQNMMTRLAGLPLAPVITWRTSAPHEEFRFIAVGIGDLLLATVFPLVMRKAFGKRVGYSAMCLMLSAILAIFAFPMVEIFPAMVVLGPIMLGQYLFCRHQGLTERTTYEYLQEES